MKEQTNTTVHYGTRTVHGTFWWNELFLLSINFSHFPPKKRKKEGLDLLSCLFDCLCFDADRNTKRNTKKKKPVHSVKPGSCSCTFSTINRVVRKYMKSFHEHIADGVHTVSNYRASSVHCRHWSRQMEKASTTLHY